MYRVNFEVLLKRFYFAPFDNGRTLKKLEVAFIGFCIEALPYTLSSLSVKRNSSLLQSGLLWSNRRKNAVKSQKVRFQISQKLLASQVGSPRRTKVGTAVT